jgi:cardiolipin synthase
MDLLTTGALVVAFHVLVEAGLIARVLLRPHRDPASRIAWVTVILAVPVAGILAYLFFGEVSIGRRRLAQMQRVLGELPDSETFLSSRHPPKPEIPLRYQHLFRAGQSSGGFEPVGGNLARLLADSNVTIDEMVADIDAATDHVHLLFYIWLPDTNGCKVVEALKRAASRGVACRAIVDDLGSRLMIRSPHWQAMRAAGVRLAVALPVGNPLLRPFAGRIDLRNHRKIVVIDNRVTYCGSQNCADPEFRVKAKYAPWVDVVMRFEGPVVRQNQYLFVGDWMTATDEDLATLLDATLSGPESGFPAQVVGTGPTTRYSAMPELFETLFHAARHDIVITTPYYVPDESMQRALCASAWRGVDVTLIVPARNDSLVVGAASRSYYPELIDAGVHLYEYPLGLLHAKTLTIDGEITLIGSANMDRRSFELNYENNILLVDAVVTAEVRKRQETFLEQSLFITEEDLAAWSVPRRLWQNAIAMFSPLA